MSTERFSYGFLAINPDENMLIDPGAAEEDAVRLAQPRLAVQPRTMFGVEYLWGQNNDMLGQQRHRSRLQATMRYDLNP